MTGPGAGKANFLASPIVLLDSHHTGFIKCLGLVPPKPNTESNMNKGIFSWSGFLLRLLFALALVYASYNPEGYSYFHWIKASLGQTETGLLGSNALKFVAGILLLIGWVIYVNATRTSLGAFGVILVLALSGGVIWLFAEMNLFNPDNIRVIVHLTEIVLAIILALGMSWSHIRRSLTGQVDVDDHDQ